jgi:hypothetical protein
MGTLRESAQGIVVACERSHCFACSPFRACKPARYPGGRMRRLPPSPCLNNPGPVTVATARAVAIAPFAKERVPVPSYVTTSRARGSMAGSASACARSLHPPERAVSLEGDRLIGAATLSVRRRPGSRTREVSRGTTLSTAVQKLRSALYICASNQSSGQRMHRSTEPNVPRVVDRRDAAALETLTDSGGGRHDSTLSCPFRYGTRWQRRSSPRRHYAATWGHRR